MPRTTVDFCATMLEAAARPLPQDVDRAARRSLLNVLGTAVSAATSDAAALLLTVSAEEGAAGNVTVPGLARTLDPYWGALAIGTAAHLDDFDDTHLATVIHPGASTLATVLSLAPETKPTGQQFLGAFAVGCEAQLRIGCAISPAHYDHGWHITGTCGVFGATVAASVLLGLDAPTTANALSLAATMTAGHREAFGTMTKPLHAGKAAANGVLAARLAAAGVAGPEDILGPGGVLEVLADAVDRDALGLGWPDGHRWELELNTIKTYPCGVVAHPAMDAAIAVSAEIGDPADITGITLHCNPLVPELMGRVQPEDGLGSRFSARHGVAVGLLYGRAGLAEFSDKTAAAPEVARLRALISLDPDLAVPRAAATLRITRRAAAPVEVTVEHTRGSAARPLTDDEVLEKVRDLFGPVLGAAAADRAWAAIRRLSEAPDPSELLGAVRPMPEPDKDGADSRNGDELAGHGVPTAEAPDGVVAFEEAAVGGDADHVVRVLRAVRPPFAATNTSWTAWLTGAAASARAGDTSDETSPRNPAGTARLTACAAAAALAGSSDVDRNRIIEAVDEGVQAAVLAESRLNDWGGWSGSTVAAAIGAAVTAGLTLGLTVNQLRNALGIAATQAAGLRAAEFTDAGPLQVGKAAFNGVEAALLARAGLTAPADPLDGRRGLFALFSQSAAVD